MPGLPYYIVDAFTSRPFSGNPAAVVPLGSWPDKSWLQSFAMEMNLSETAYFVANAAGYDLRWFTPQVEVELCGHGSIHLPDAALRGAGAAVMRAGSLRERPFDTSTPAPRSRGRGRFRSGSPQAQATSSSPADRRLPRRMDWPVRRVLLGDGALSEPTRDYGQWPKSTTERDMRQADRGRLWQASHTLEGPWSH